MSEADPISDEALMRAYAAGDYDAFAILYGRYSDRVYSFVRKRLKREETSNDCFQEIFLRLHKAKASYSPAYAFAPWFFTLCRNVVYDHLRAEKYSPAIDSDTSPELVGGDYRETETQLAISELKEDLQSLSSEEERVFYLRVAHGFSHREIASRLELTVANSRKIFSRCLNKLKIARHLE